MEKHDKTSLTSFPSIDRRGDLHAVGNLAVVGAEAKRQPQHHAQADDEEQLRSGGCHHTELVFGVKMAEGMTAAAVMIIMASDCQC